MPALAEIASSIVRWDEEVTTGTAPGGAYQVLRRLSDSLAGVFNNIESELISTDPQIQSQARVGQRVSGTIETELFCNIAEYFPLIAAAMRTNPVTVSSTDTDYEITGTDTLTRTASHEAALIASTAPGTIIRIAGFTDPANNGVFKIITVDDVNNLELQNLDGSTAVLVNEAVGDTVTISANHLRNGSVKRSFTFEREQTDLAAGNKFQRFVNCRIAGLTIGITFEQLATLTLVVEGTIASSQATTDSSGDIAAGTEDTLTGSGDAANLALDNVAITDNYRSFSVTLDNQAEAPGQIGSDAPVDVTQDRTRVNGTLEAYYQSATIYAKVINDTATAFSLSLTDAAGNLVYIKVPRIFLNGSPSGDRTPVISAEFISVKDSTDLTSLQIDYLPV